MWIADALTLVRVPIAIFIWLAYGDVAWCVALVGLAALTDTLDGTVARALRRRRGRVDAPSHGDWLDPLADKLFVAIVVTAVAVHAPSSWPVLGLIAARELVLVPIAALYVALRRRPRRPLRAAPIGKAATVAQFLAMAALLGGAPDLALGLGIIAAVTGLAAAIQFVLRA